MARHSEKGKIEVSIVIPTINKEKDLIACIDSLKNSEHKLELEIIVVDDFSKDQTYSLLRKTHPDVKLILHSKNLGFGTSCNDGIKTSTSDKIIILNDDTIASKNWISEMLRPLKDGKCGIASCKILFLDPSQKTNLLWYAGGFLTPLLPRISWHRGYKETDVGQYNKIEEVEFCSGCAMAFRRDFLEKVGMFDEDFFLYFEDADLCVRARRAGYKLIYNPNAVLWHAESKTTRRESRFWIFHRERSRVLFIRKNFWYLLPLFIIYNFLIYLPQSVWFAVKNRDAGLVSVSFAGFLSGLRN